ncbi:hypothetical protein J6590_016166 [Homalodisca vitripennis]|nr:hypothetical protein J6590_016166 [Homalodisca vitripennis]
MVQNMKKVLEQPSTDRLLRHETVRAWRGEEFEEKCGPGWVRGAGRQVRPAATSTTADIRLMRVSRHCIPLKLHDSKILLANKIKYYYE